MKSFDLDTRFVALSPGRLVFADLLWQRDLPLPPSLDLACGRLDVQVSPIISPAFSTPMLILDIVWIYARLYLRVSSYLHCLLWNGVRPTDRPTPLTNLIIGRPSVRPSVHRRNDRLDTLCSFWHRPSLKGSRICMHAQNITTRSNEHFERLEVFDFCCDFLRMPWFPRPLPVGRRSGQRRAKRGARKSWNRFFATRNHTAGRATDARVGLSVVKMELVGSPLARIDD